MADDADRISALRASAHPVRLRMLSLLTGSALSAAEVARELDLTHANASYHLRVLLDAGELVEAGEERIRGGVAKRYRYPHERGGVNASSVPASADDRAFYTHALAAELERRVRRSARGQRGIHSDLEGWVTPEVWQRACDLVAEASRLLHEQNAAPRTEGTVHVSGTSWMFRLDDDHDGEPR